VASNVNVAGHCRHCGNTSSSEFCCVGCETVFRLLQDQDLGRYYELKDCAIPSANMVDNDPAGTLWLERTDADLARRTDPSRLRVSIEGIHCAACVWLIEEVTRRASQDAEIVVNPALGSAELTVPPGFSLAGLADTLRAFGYRVGPETAHARRASDDLLWRMGVSIALALNVMSFAFARYAGLAEDRLGRTLMLLELVLSSVSLVVGGPIFFRAAWQGLKRGILHLDLPIAVGLLASYAGSLALTIAGRHGTVFYDTISVFLALMLVGRFLRERVLEKNRAFLLTENDAGSLLVRRKVVVDGTPIVEVVPADELAIGDEIVLAPRDVAPVAAVLLEEQARFSAAWLTGESDEKLVSRGRPILAGMANAEASPVHVAATEPLAESRLLPLMRTPIRDERYGDLQSARERFVAKYWVLFVALAAVLGSIVTYARTGDGWSTLEALTAILVVTCPCGFGIATPLATEITLLSLRKAGILVRSSTLLERLLGVAHVVFDKTGTLTESRLSTGSRQELRTLEPTERLVLANLAQRSRHPKAVALAAAARLEGERAWLALSTKEEPGRGLTAEYQGSLYALGSPRWLAPSSEGDIVFTRDGALLFSARTEDALFDDAVATATDLERRGVQAHLATGDARVRAARVAATCRIPAERTLAEATPEAKAAYVESLGEGVLFVGDGLNDALAATRASASGTPVAGTTFLAARTDFYLLEPGVAGVLRLIDTAKLLRAAQSKSLTWAAAYNALALGLAFAGWMSPLWAAILMPASTLVSIGIVLASTRAMRRPRPEPTALPAPAEPDLLPTPAPSS
jgi:P-type Cu2+ transporter